MVAAEFPSGFQSSEGSFHKVSTRVSIAAPGFQVSTHRHVNLETVNHPGRAAMGEVFEGYKGGDFQMGRNTPVWLASYGCSGEKIMAIREDGALELAADE